MAFMPWSQELVLGIASMNEQHRELVDRINALHVELGRPAPDAQTLGRGLEDLVDAAMNHFIAEEELLTRHGDAQAGAHTQAHSGETGKLVELLDQVHADPAALQPAHLAALKDWLTQHIQGDDRACVALLLSKGAQ